MKLNDPRLEIIARDLGLKALSPVIAVAGLLKEGFDSRQICEILKSKADCIEPVYRRVREIIDGDRAKRAQTKIKKKPTIPHLLPRDWELDEKDIAYAKALGLDDVQIKIEHAGFVRYFTVRKPYEKRPGWSDSWANWVKKAAINGKTVTPNEAPKDGRSREAWESAIDIFHRTGSWPMSWGPDPDQPDCQAPAELLRGVRA